MPSNRHNNQPEQFDHRLYRGGFGVTQDDIIYRLVKDELEGRNHQNNDREFYDDDDDDDYEVEL